MKNPRRHRFARSDVVRAAYLAGSGSTTDDIADTLRTTRLRAYWLLRNNGIAPFPKSRSQVAFVVVISRATLAELERVGGPLGVDPQQAMSHVVTRVAEDSAVLREIIKEGAASRPARPTRKAARSGSEEEQSPTP